jgi:hypothetical protein
MQNPSVGNKGTAKQLQNISESARDTAEQAATDFSQKANRMASETSESTGEYYDKASNWIQENYGKTLSVLGAVAAAGTIGYLMGKNSHQDSEYQQQRR